MRPNFFIVGAPKCGTTSLTHWLQGHPNVFLPTKEMHFFNTDHITPWRPSLREYEGNYERVHKNHTAIGDSSVWYLASERAIPAILDYNPQSKFIACVRNPVEMAYSIHNQNIFEGIEPIASFEEAWAVQDRRAIFRRRPAVEPFHLNYGLACKLGAQLQKALDFAGDRLHIVFLEDLAARPTETYEQVLTFLGLVQTDIHFQPANKAQRRKSVLLKRATRTLGIAKRKMQIRGSLGLLSTINAWNRKEQPWEPNRKMDEVLIKYFADDIALISILTGRNLEHWLVPGTARPGG